jgi:hypothetical protein
VRGLYISLAIEMWFFIETGLVFRKENQTPSSSSSKPSEKTTDVHTLGAASRSWKSKKEQMDLCVTQIYLADAWNGTWNTREDF